MTKKKQVVAEPVAPVTEQPAPDFNYMATFVAVNDNLRAVVATLELEYTAPDALSGEFATRCQYRMQWIGQAQSLLTELRKELMRKGIIDIGDTHSHG